MPPRIVSWRPRRPRRALEVRVVRAAAAALVAVMLPLAMSEDAPAASALPAAAERPAITWKPIPFPERRRAETAAYARRHYGTATWRLVRPQVIVQHFTAGTTFSSAYWTFASDAPDRELHETPGTCAHFVIDTDGTIYQLVRTSVMCRHTVGLNWTAIGIEHVGTSDAQVLGNGAQMASSLALTAWLMDWYGITLGNVIGHNESLTSRYRREAYPGWRCQTHADFPKTAMEQYRSRLRPVLQRASVPVGPPVLLRDSGC
jgi:beta-N-acetylhexosaminidase